MTPHHHLAAALAGLALSPLAALAAPVLSITPSVQAVNVGDTVEVAITISGLGAAPANQIVSNFDLDVLFGSLLSQIGGATFQAEGVMGGAGLVDFDTIGTGPGVATGNAFSFVGDDVLAGLQSDAFTLFTLSFEALADGVARLDFGPSMLFERLVVGRDGLALDLSYNGACIAIGDASCLTVPEPSTYALACIALLAAAGSGRSRRRDVRLSLDQASPAAG